MIGDVLFTFKDF